MRPTYVKVPVQTVDQLKFWERDDVRAMKMAHLEEKRQILDENAGLRALMGEEASDVVREVRETEDGVNRALLLAAVGAAIVAVVRSRLGGEEDRAKRAKAARVATEEEEMSDEDEEEEDEEEEQQQQPRRSARSSSRRERRRDAR